MPKRKNEVHSENIVFCRKCGNKLLPDTMFCELCGTRVTSPIMTNEQENISSVNVQEAQSSKKVSVGTIILFSLLGGYC